MLQEEFSNDEDSEVPISIRYDKYQKTITKWIKKDIDFVDNNFEYFYTRNIDDLSP